MEDGSENWSIGVLLPNYPLLLHHFISPISLDHSFFAELCNGFTIVAERL